MLSILFLNFFFNAGALPDTLRNAVTIKSDSLKRKPEGAVVAPFGAPIFNIYANIGPFTPEDRAKAIDQKVKTIAGDPFFSSDSATRTALARSCGCSSFIAVWMMSGVTASTFIVHV